MSLKKCKLVLKTRPTTEGFEIFKAVNTIKFGIPGGILSTPDVEKLLKDNNREIERGTFTVEFIK